MKNAFECSNQNLFINFIIIYSLGAAPKNGVQVIKELISENEYELDRLKIVFEIGSAINDSYRVQREKTQKYITKKQIYF